MSWWNIKRNNSFIKEKKTTREDFRERIKVNIPSGAYPFDSEEMLLNAELKKEKKMNNKQKKILGNNPFDAEEMLLNTELKKMEEGR